MITKVTIEGYGQAGLIPQLNQMHWKPVFGGENFPGIAFGGAVLTKPPDHICPDTYYVHLVEVPKEWNPIQFRVEGYQVPMLLQTITLLRLNEITLLGTTLNPLPTDEKPIAYRLIVILT